MRHLYAMIFITDLIKNLEIKEICLGLSICRIVIIYNLLLLTKIFFVSLSTIKCKHSNKSAIPNVMSSNESVFDISTDILGE